ncbi:MAG: amino acid permease [Gemmatimonadota bacterium]|nr:amino acid permease [Gemmatimonadota bacterium]
MPTGARSRRGLGLPMATALVVGNMIGSGVFLLPASLGPYGAVSMVGWAFSSAGAMLLALTFAWLARDLPQVGGPYAYTRAAFGDFPAFLVAWGYWISICAGNAAIAVALVGYLGFLWPPLGATPGTAAIVAVIAVWLLTWVNHRGVREAGAVQLVTTVLKLVPLIAIGTLGLVFAEWKNFVPFNPSGHSTFGAVSATATLTLWAFLGLESATIPAAEVDRPDRTIPRATLLGTAIAAVVYVLGTVAVMGVLSPAAVTTSTAPFADAAARMWGGWASYAVALGAAVSCFGALNGWILLQGQIPLAAATDGLFPTVFGRRSGRGTPTPALILSSVLITLIVAANYTKGLVGAFTFIILFATLAVLIPYAFSSMALVVSDLRRKQASSARRVTVALLAFAFSTWAIVGSGAETVLWGCVLLLAGVPIYWMMIRRRP